MNKIVPFFEVNGKRYEIKKTRWLLAEYDKLSEQSTLSNEDKENAIKMQSLVNDVQKYADKVQEFWDIYMETFEDIDEKKYLKVKALYDNALAELAHFEVTTNSVNTVQKAGIDALEKIAIKGLAEQYFDMDESKAIEVWKTYVEKVGNNKVVEWLNAMSQCLFNEEEEEENSFLSQMRKKAEEKANFRKTGLKIIKKK